MHQVSNVLEQLLGFIYIYIDGFSSNTLQALRQVQRPKEVGQKKYSNRKRSTLIIYSCDSCVMYAFLWSNLPFK